MPRLQEVQASLFASTACRDRARAEQAMGRFRRFDRVALWGGKTKRNIASMVALASGFVLGESVHTT